MTLNAKIGFFGDFGLRHNSMAFARCRHATITRYAMQMEILVFVY